uniref:Solute carrier family 25 member 48 n=1 Tax=Paramormyrops kingsleyae TaxID=1676925 RepID=A0A3B3R0R5_9TELE
MSSFHVDDFIAGWIGGDRSLHKIFHCCVPQTRLQAGKGYRNTLHCILTIYQKESIYGFFKGLSFPLASITLYNSMVFGFFSNAQRLLSQLRHGDARRPCGMLDLALASMMTGLVSVGVGGPVDLVKIRLQMQSQPLLAGNLQGTRLYRGPLHCIGSILQTEGVLGLYRGAGAMILRDVPGYTLYFIPYILLCDWLTPEGSTSPHPCFIWLAGGLAGSVSWVTATPTDVIKSRLQADVLHQRKYEGILHCINHSYKTEGLHVFFRGATVNAIRGFPMSATMFLGYELSLKFIRGL